ncbi:hypothetical protein ACVDFE_24390 [Lentzea chajnantorensis]
MHWSAYEVFSVLSGVTVLILALVARGMNGRSRALAVFSGLFCIVLGFYVAAQTNGTYYFPRRIFFIPFVAVGCTIYEVVKRKRGTGARRY